MSFASCFQFSQFLLRFIPSLHLFLTTAYVLLPSSPYTHLFYLPTHFPFCTKLHSSFFQLFYLTPCYFLTLPVSPLLPLTLFSPSPRISSRQFFLSLPVSNHSFLASSPYSFSTPLLPLLHRLKLSPFFSSLFPVLPHPITSKRHPFYSSLFNSLVSYLLHLPNLSTCTASP